MSALDRELERVAPGERIAELQHQVSVLRRQRDREIPRIAWRELAEQAARTIGRRKAQP